MNFFATAGQSSIAMLSRQLLEDLAVKRRTADEVKICPKMKQLPGVPDRG